MIRKTPLQHSKAESNSATCQMATIRTITDTVVSMHLMFLLNTFNTTSFEITRFLILTGWLKINCHSVARCFNPKWLALHSRYFKHFNSSLVIDVTSTLLHSSTLRARGTYLNPNFEPYKLKTVCPAFDGTLTDVLTQGIQSSTTQYFCRDCKKKQVNSDKSAQHFSKCQPLFPLALTNQMN